MIADTAKTLRFNTQPPEGGCTSNTVFILNHAVSTHSRPKAAVPVTLSSYSTMPFQHTAARRRLDVLGYLDIRRSLVSTHSRPKAAVEGGIRAEVIESFNTQPPEGGWGILLTLLNTWLKFQHTAARRRLLSQ